MDEYESLKPIAGNQILGPDLNLKNPGKSLVPVSDYIASRILIESRDIRSIAFLAQVSPKGKAIPHPPQVSPCLLFYRLLSTFLTPLPKWRETSRSTSACPPRSSGHRQAGLVSGCIAWARGLAEAEISSENVLKSPAARLPASPYSVVAESCSIERGTRGITERFHPGLVPVRLWTQGSVPREVRERAFR